METWKGKVAVVTGVSSGIGRAIAIALLNRGVHVAGLSRRLDKMNEIEEEVNKDGLNGTFLPLKCDVTRSQDVGKAFEEILKSLGAPSVLINNAGIFKMGELISINVDDARSIFETNVLAVIALTKEALTHMNPEGVVININSIVGQQLEGSFGTGAYRSSKRALTSLTQTLKNELFIKGSHIRVTSISPGPVKSEMTAQIGRYSSLNEILLLEAEDIADCVVFVLSLPGRVNISEMIVEPREFPHIKILTNSLQKAGEKNTA